MNMRNPKDSMFTSIHFLNWKLTSNIVIMSLMFSSEAKLHIVIHFLFFFAIIWQTALGLSGIVSAFTSYLLLNFSSSIAATRLGAWIEILRISLNNWIGMDMIILSILNPLARSDYSMPKIGDQLRRTPSFIFLNFQVSLLYCEGYPGFPLLNCFDNPFCSRGPLTCWLQLTEYLSDHRIQFAACPWQLMYSPRASEWYIIHSCRYLYFTDIKWILIVIKHGRSRCNRKIICRFRIVNVVGYLW